MKVYNIQTPFNYSQTSCVVARDMAEAEKLFKDEYGFTTKIVSITIHADYVIVSPDALK